MVGKSPAMREIFGLIEKIAPTDATVLIEGETGTGKDMIARTLHAAVAARGAAVHRGRLRRGRRHADRERAVRPREGRVHRRGRRARQGAFELARGGTVFLDELGELSLDLQPKLLRVLEQRELRRVGGTKTIKVDLRVIAATRKDLRSRGREGQVPRGPLLPAQRRADHRAAAARAPRGHPAADRRDAQASSRTSGGGRR